MKRSLRLLAAAVAVLLTAAAPAGAADADPLSDRSVQEIGDLDLARAGDGVRVSFTVAHPAVGVGPASDRVRVDVWDSRLRRLRLGNATATMKVGARGGRRRARLVVEGRAARRLLRAGLGPKGRAIELVTVSSASARQVDHDPEPDHTMLVVESGPEAAQPLPVARMAGKSAHLRIVNDSTRGIAITATPVTCVYDNGPMADAYSNGDARRYNEDGSNLSALNGLTVAGGGGLTVAQYVENNARMPDFGGGGARQVNEPYGGTFDEGYGPQVLDNADRTLRSPAVRGLIIAAVQKYWGNGAAVELFPAAVDVMPYGLEPCTTATSLFAVGADQFAAEMGGPTAAHAEGLFQITGNEVVAKRADLSAQRLAIEVMPGRPNHLRVRDSLAGASPYERWMEEVLPPGSAAAKRRLTDLQLPGSHDAGTATLSVGMAWLRPFEDRCGDYNAAMKLATGVVQRMAVTQSLMMRDQLDLGIRYLDLRAAWDDRPRNRSGQRFRILHAISSLSSLRTELKAIANWAAAHPTEIVILDFNHLCLDGHANEFVRDLNAADELAGSSVCDLAYRVDDPRRLTAATVEEIRASGRNLVVLVDRDQAEPALRSCGAYRQSDSAKGVAGPGIVPTQSIWPNVAGPGACPTHQWYFDQLPGAGQAIASAPLDRMAVYREQDPTPLLITQTQFTVSEPGQIKSVAPCGLLGYQRPYNRIERPKVIARWGTRANVIIGDAVDTAFVGQVVDLNR